MDIKMEPVPRGYWVGTIIVKQDNFRKIKCEKGFTCSVCKGRAPENKEHKYCPHCGAKMKVE